MARRDQARRYLEETAMPMGQLSALRGYSEQSSLSRACRTWFGASPQAVRTRAASKPTRDISTTEPAELAADFGTPDAFQPRRQA